MGDKHLQNRSLQVLQAKEICVSFPGDVFCSISEMKCSMEDMWLLNRRNLRCAFTDSQQEVCGRLMCLL